MVFWSSWAKKVRESINKLTFDKLKNRVDIIENDYATKTYTDAQDTTLSNRITANTNRVVRIETELGNANFVLYMGPWSASETYKKGLAVTEGDLWYVSNVDNNINHRPSGVSDQFWKLITSPSINLNDYYTKAQADARYAFKGDISNLQGQINDANTSITNLDNTMTNSFRQLDSQINTVRDTANRTQANLTNNYYNKTTSDNRYALKSQGFTIQNIPMSNFRIIRNEIYFGNRRIRLYDMINVNVNLGLIQNMVLKSNDNIFVEYSWYIDVYNNVAKIILTRFDTTNDWTPNFTIDMYVRNQ